MAASDRSSTVSNGRSPQRLSGSGEKSWSRDAQWLHRGTSDCTKARVDEWGTWSCITFLTTTVRWKMKQAQLRFFICQALFLRILWNSYGSSRSGHSRRFVRPLLQPRRGCRVLSCTTETNGSPERRRRRKGDKNWPSSPLLGVWKGKAMCGQWGTVQHWTYDQKSCHIWSFLTTPCNIQCTRWGEKGDTYWLEEVTCGIVIKSASSHSKPDHMGSLA